MIVFILYLLEASICLLVLGMFYLLAWRRLSFHQLKRFLLLTICTFVVLAPIIEFPLPQHANEQLGQLSTMVGEWELQVQEVVASEPFNMSGTFADRANHPKDSWTISHLILLIYLFGVGLASVRLSSSLWAIYQLMKKHSLSSQNGYWLAETHLSHSFSFASVLFISHKHLKLPREELQQIILHEKAHIHQRHTIDILLVELMGLLFWFHPIIYVLRKELKQIHEYLADQEVLKHIQPSRYAQLLLKLAIQKPTLSLSLIHPFIYVSLKNRIIMMNNQNSSKWKLLLMFPAFMILSALWVLFSPALAEIKEEVRPLITQEVITSIHQTDVAPDKWPMDGGKIRSGFGMRLNPYTQKKQMHTGIDIGAPTGTFVFAAGDGKVLKTGFDRKKGKFIEIEHGSQYQTHYFHLVEIGAKEGQSLKKGQQIGKSGNTGVSKGPHLHFEIWKDGESVDPLPYLKKDMPKNAHGANGPTGSPIEEMKLKVPFGPRIHPVTKTRKHHLGIDLDATEGTPIYATGNGEVVWSGTKKGGYGIHIKIKHADDYTTLYAHLSETTVNRGDKIKEGDLIGYTGNTGLSIGPHLHYEIIKSDKRVDPIKFLPKELFK